MTRLARPMDWKARSNQFVVVGSALVAGAYLGWGRFRDGDWDWAGAVWAGAGAFIGWAAARELDPDRDTTAALALVLAGIAAFADWDPALLLCAIAVVGLRVLSGTVGGTLRPLDQLLLLGAAVYCGTRVEGWVVVLLLVLAVLDDQPRGYSVVTVAMLVGATIAGYVSGVQLASRPLVDEDLMWTMVVAASIVLAIRTERLRSTTDLHRRPVLWPKVRAARVMSGFVVFGGLLGGGSTLLLMTPILAALVSTALLRTFRPVSYPVRL